MSAKPSYLTTGRPTIEEQADNDSFSMQLYREYYGEHRQRTTTHAALARKYGVHPNTINNRLGLARRWVRGER